MILIGSRALTLRSPSLLNRKPKDFDWVCTREELDDWMKKNLHKVRPEKQYFTSDNKKFIIEGTSNCEFEIIKDGTSSKMLFDIVSNDEDTIETSFGLVPSLDMLFTIKSSHKYLKNSPAFWKNLLDYNILKSVGAKVRPEYKEFLRIREKETYNYAHPNLNQSKKDFFSDDAIEYVYDHDSIHESVKMFDRPAYTYYMKDGAQVQTDKNKFFALPKEIQIAGVIEESSVLAIERSLVPHPGIKSPKEAFLFALSKVCTSITSGWFREFAYENALDIAINKSDYPFWEKFQEGLKTGIVKPFSK